jgi:chorismate mutase
MENIYEKFENDLNVLSENERKETLIKLRDDIDVIDKELVKLLNRRTLDSVLIGRVKKTLGIATYNPQREKEIAEKIGSYAEKPLAKEAVLRIYERILDESRAIQKEESRNDEPKETGRSCVE